jgi:hypothetical protein
MLVTNRLAVLAAQERTRDHAVRLRVEEIQGRPYEQLHLFFDVAVGRCPNSEVDDREVAVDADD